MAGFYIELRIGLGDCAFRDRLVSWLDKSIDEKIISGYREDLVERDDCISLKLYGNPYYDRIDLAGDVADELGRLIVKVKARRWVEDKYTDEVAFVAWHKNLDDRFNISNNSELLWNKIISDDKNDFFKKWCDIIGMRIKEYLSENITMDLEGFMRFRLKDFIDDLKGNLKNQTDKIIIEREYNEFIKLLRYFVEVQEPKVTEVHVYTSEEGKYTILDAQLKPIDFGLMEDMAKELTDDELSQDDLLISSLITIAPGRIFIHGWDRIRNKQLLGTIENVFIGKVTMETEQLH